MKPTIKRMFIGSIVGTVVPPVLGTTVTVFAMIRAFSTLQAKGISDPNTLANAVGTTLIATWAGLVIGIISLVIFLITLFVHSSDKPAPPVAPSLPR